MCVCVCCCNSPQHRFLHAFSCRFSSSISLYISLCNNKKHSHTHKWKTTRICGALRECNTAAHVNCNMRLLVFPFLLLQMHICNLFSILIQFYCCYCCFLTVLAIFLPFFEWITVERSPFFSLSWYSLGPRSPFQILLRDRWEMQS